MNNIGYLIFVVLKKQMFTCFCILLVGVANIWSVLDSN